MKKTKGQGRKLLLRGEAVARLTRGQLENVVGGDQPAPGSALYPISCHVSDIQATPAKK